MEERAGGGRRAVVGQWCKESRRQQQALLMQRRRTQPLVALKPGHWKLGLEPSVMSLKPWGLLAPSLYSRGFRKPGGPSHEE